MRLSCRSLIMHKYFVHNVSAARETYITLFYVNGIILHLLRGDVVGQITSIIQKKKLKSLYRRPLHGLRALNNELDYATKATLISWGMIDFKDVRHPLTADRFFFENLRHNIKCAVLMRLS
jgi:hypothetical protein